MRLTKKEYIDRIDEIKGQVAAILASGSDVELCESRSGLKLFAVKRTHQVLDRSKKNDRG